MKRILLVTTLLIVVALLTGCSKVKVSPDIINVVYENPRYENDNFYIDIHITNGTEEDLYIGNMDFSINPKDSETEVAAASFEINETVISSKYISLELEFEKEYVFIDSEELTRLGYNVENLELYFWIK